jgi:hypothetical protein
MKVYPRAKMLKSFSPKKTTFSAASGGHSIMGNALDVGWATAGFSAAALKRLWSR